MAIGYNTHADYVHEDQFHEQEEQVQVLLKRTRDTNESPALVEARAAADRAAERAGVVVRSLRTPEDSMTAAHLLDSIWNSDGKGTPPVEPTLLIALEHGGNYVAGAYRDDQMIGVAAGFCGPPETAMLHSHVAGVAGTAKGKGIGAALKLHQRVWCLEHEITTMEWTFDPLILRNAYFNLNRLGARLDEYLPHFYGEMSDGTNAGQGSDRALVRWTLTETGGASAAAPVVPEQLPIFLDVGAEEEPVVTRSAEQALAGDLHSLGLRIPANIERLRLLHPDLSAQWRTALREGMYPLMQVGWRIRGVSSDGTYILHSPEEKR